MEKIRFNDDEKFDIQLSAALVQERRLAAIFGFSEIADTRIELKTETWQWEQTGNICIEYLRDGKPSGISTCTAEYWSHQLCRPDGETICYLLFPIEQIKELARAAIRAGRWRAGAGDGGRQTVALVRLRDILK